MSIEEAIEQFQNAIDLIKQNGKDWLDERDIPMLEMAIKALKKKEKLKVEVEKWKSYFEQEIENEC